MRYYWIVRYQGNVKIVDESSFIFRRYTDDLRTGIGPYFSYKEAMAVLYTWTK